ncbi:hypothetical protein SteCoe_39400 [Stentor coeruleus]|uniref:Uncharacterized protein n=1 Tax=Stentor coeruleus TaxID=5963 RepID=A0A1R2AKN1_9CILI|nr:hypothetical protein SteCoe_39400 [Stentor coeruleus]
MESNKDYKQGQKTKRNSSKNISPPENANRKNKSLDKKKEAYSFEKPKQNSILPKHIISNSYQHIKFNSQAFNNISELPEFNSPNFEIHTDNKTYKKLYTNLYRDFLCMQRFYRKSLDEIRKYKLESKTFKEKNEKLEEVINKLKQKINKNNCDKNDLKSNSSSGIENVKQKTEPETETENIAERDEIIRLQFGIIHNKTCEISKLQSQICDMQFGIIHNKTCEISKLQSQICDMQEQLKILELEKQERHINKI